MVDDFQSGKRTVVVSAVSRTEARTVARARLLEQEAEWVASGGDVNIRDVRELPGSGA